MQLDIWAYVWFLPGFVVLDMVGKTILKTEGVKVVQIRSIIVYGYLFFRVKFRIDTSQPLRKFYCITLDDKTEYIGLLRYERLADICYRFG